MVELSVTASVSVREGPLLPLGLKLEPHSYVFADAALEPAETHDVALPATGVPLLLAVRIVEASGGAGKATITPHDAGNQGGPVIEVGEGTLLIANEQVIAGLVAGGPRRLTVANMGASPVTASILVALRE